MTQSFEAKFIFSDDMGDYWLVGLADSQTDTTEYVQFQRAHEFDEQDERLGMDEVYVERNDQAYSRYGGMSEVVLTDNDLSIRLTPDGADDFGGLKRMRIAISVDDADFRSLREGLSKCFAGFGYFTDASTR